MQLRHVAVLTRDMDASLRFWGAAGLGLAVRAHSPVFAELALPSAVPDGPTLALKLASTEAALSAGYTPQLVFDVERDTLDALLHRLCGVGAHLDGPVKYAAYGKLASVRSVDGVIVGLFERAT